MLQHHSKRPCLTTLEPGDRLLIRNLSGRGGTGKMSSYWEEQIYIIVSSIDNDPVVYKIRPEYSSKGKTRTVHRNMLMHCDNLLENSDTGTSENQHPKSIQFKQELIIRLGRLVKGFKINLKSPSQLQVSQTRRISVQSWQLASAHGKCRRKCRGKLIFHCFTSVKFCLRKTFFHHWQK